MPVSSRRQTASQAEDLMDVILIGNEAEVKGRGGEGHSCHL